VIRGRPGWIWLLLILKLVVLRQDGLESVLDGVDRPVQQQGTVTHARYGCPGGPSTYALDCTGLTASPAPLTALFPVEYDELCDDWLVTSQSVPSMIIIRRP
jgi:hypothetical protein